MANNPNDPKDSKEIAARLAREAEERERAARMEITEVIPLEQVRRVAGESKRKSGVPEATEAPETPDMYPKAGKPEDGKKRRGLAALIGAGVLLSSSYLAWELSPSFRSFGNHLGNAVAYWTPASLQGLGNPFENAVDFYGNLLKRGYASLNTADSFDKDDKENENNFVAASQRKPETGLRKLEPILEESRSSGNIGELPSPVLGTSDNPDNNYALGEEHLPAKDPLSAKDFPANVLEATPAPAETGGIENNLNQNPPKLTEQNPTEQNTSPQDPSPQTTTELYASLDNLLVDHDDNPETPKITLRKFIDEYKRLKKEKNQLLRGIVELATVEVQEKKINTLFEYVEAIVSVQNGLMLKDIFAYVLLHKNPNTHTLREDSYEDVVHLVVEDYETVLKPIGISPETYNHTISGDSSASGDLSAGKKGAAQLLAEACNLPYPLPAESEFELYLERTVEKTGADTMAPVLKTGGN